MGREFQELEAELNRYPFLQVRTEFKHVWQHITYWEPTGDEEIPYRFIAGARYDRRNIFLKRLYGHEI